jgi:hypothetical protein
MELKANGVRGKRAARQPCPPDRAFAFFDPLLRRAALVVKATTRSAGCARLVMMKPTRG